MTTTAAASTTTAHDTTTAPALSARGITVTYPDGRNDHWSGLRPDLLDKYITSAKAQAAA